MNANTPITDFALSSDFLGCLFDGVIHVRNARVVWANDAARKLLGLAENIEGAAISQISPEAQGIMACGEQGRFHFWRQRIDPATNISRRDLFIADTRWIADEGGCANGQLVFRDASDLALVEKRLINTAFKDDSSGLLTAVGFVDLADTTFSRARKDDRLTLVVVMYLPDLINFELEPVVHAGVVSDIAVRICYALRGNDLAAYLGQSEFAIMLNNVAQLDQALAVIKRIASRVSSPFQCKGNIVRLQALLGIAIYGVDGQAAKPLMEAAARASAEGHLEDPGTFFSITFANKEIQWKSEREAVRAERLRQEVLQGNTQFDVAFFDGEAGSACLITPVLAGFSEEEIWAAYELESTAPNLVRAMIDHSSTVTSDIFIFSYPERHSKIGNNAMVMLAATRGLALSQFFSCPAEVAQLPAGEGLRIAARWNGNKSLSSLRSAGVSLLLVKEALDDPLLAAEVSVAKQFFKVFTLRAD
ncbi:diguanylate cyclase [Janthinobacterium sp. 17J80-10]|uniref:GGDEF domain-containing protein n=1 Tax=Janthinobacterium sp. 17J80-10 TaxID=2497863 RepID=UPI0013E8C179|nr:diguanylate cyclase [Janthinobacterium sp. 17J80-10]